MAFYIYSEEAFPGSKESGRHQEYVQVLGVQIIIPERTWVKLDSRYTEPRRHADWKDEQGSEPVHFADEIARELEVRYGFRGIVVLTDNAPGSAEAMTLEKRAADLNRKWREQVVQDYLRERQRAEITGHGRYEPTLYEVECFKVLGIEMPNTVGALRQAQQPVQVTVQLTPETVAQAVAQSGSPKAARSTPVATLEATDEAPTRSPGEPLR